MSRKNRFKGIVPVDTDDARALRRPYAFKGIVPPASKVAVKRNPTSRDAQTVLRNLGKYNSEGGRLLAPLYQAVRNSEPVNEAHIKKVEAYIRRTVTAWKRDERVIIDLAEMTNFRNYSDNAMAKTSRGIAQVQTGVNEYKRARNDVQKFQASKKILEGFEMYIEGSIDDVGDFVYSAMEQLKKEGR